MQRFDILKDGPYRYIHSTETGQLLLTLATIGSRFFDFDEVEPGIHTMREWKAILARRYPNITAS